MKCVKWALYLCVCWCLCAKAGSLPIYVRRRAVYRVCVLVSVCALCVCLIGGAGWVGGLGCDMEWSHRSLIYVLPTTHRSPPRPGVRLSALSIILALCGIPRIPRPPLLRPRCDAAVSHLVQDQIRGHSACQRRIWLQDSLAVNRSFCSGGAVEGNGELDVLLVQREIIWTEPCTGPWKQVAVYVLLSVPVDCCQDEVYYVLLYLDHPSPQVIMLINVWSDD